MAIFGIGAAAIVGLGGFWTYAHFKTRPTVIASSSTHDLNAGGANANSSMATTSQETAPPPPAVPTRDVTHPVVTPTVPTPTVPTPTAVTPAAVTPAVVNIAVASAPVPYVPPHWIPWPIPEDKDSVVALYYQASQRPATGNIQAGAVFEGFIATGQGGGITKIRLRFEAAAGTMVVGDGTLCTLEPMDGPRAQKVLRGIVANGSIKFAGAPGGPALISATPASVFDGDSFSLTFKVNQYGLVGAATGVDWVLLLEPAA